MMKNKFFKLASIALSSIAMFSAVACGGEVVGGELPDDKPTISMIYYKGGYGEEYMKKTVENFNNRAKAGEYDFYVTAMADEGVTGTVETQINQKDNGADVVDVAICNSIMLQEWALLGHATDITDVFKTEVTASNFEGGKATIEKKIDQRLGSRICYDGKYYGLPLQGGVTGLLYNTSLYKAVTGLDTPPQTMKEVWDVLDKVEKYTTNTNGSTADDVYAFIYAGNAIGYYQYFTYCGMAQYLGMDEFYNLYDLHGVMDKFQADGYKDAYENTFEGIVKVGQPMYPTKNDPKFHMTTATSHTLALNAFADGRAVFTPCGDWTYNEIAAADASMAKDVSIMPIPLVCDPETGLVTAVATPSSKVQDENDYFKVERAKVDPAFIPTEDATAEYIYFEKYSYSLGADVFGIIPNGSKNVDKAKKFLAYLASDEALQMFTKYAGSRLPYDYEVPTDIYNGLSDFSKTCVDLLDNVQSIYMASTYKGVSYGIVNMFLNTTGNMHGELLVWGSGTTPSSIASGLYSNIKTKLTKEMAKVDQSIQIFEDLAKL